MIKNGHISVVFLPKKSEPARITCQTTVFTVLAFLFCVSAQSQTANSPAAPESSPAPSGRLTMGDAQPDRLTLANVRYR
jgi:hypothetical protein